MTYCGGSGGLFNLGYLSSGSWGSFNRVSLNDRRSGSGGFRSRHYENVVRELKRYALDAESQASKQTYTNRVSNIEKEMRATQPVDPLGR